MLIEVFPINLVWLCFEAVCFLYHQGLRVRLVNQYFWVFMSEFDFGINIFIILLYFTLFYIILHCYTLSFINIYYHILSYIIIYYHILSYIIIYYHIFYICSRNSRWLNTLRKNKPKLIFSVIIKYKNYKIIKNN